jgi:hypothetical protein
MRGEKQFSFVVDHGVSGRMDRVVVMNDGQILEKTVRSEGVFYRVSGN